jgi:hypothetical protein
MAQKRFWFSVVAVWLVMFVTDWFFHGMWLGPLYQSTSQFWKSPQDAQSMMWAAWLGNFVFAWAFVWIYKQGISQDNPWHQAFRYALAILLVSKVPTLLGQWTYSAFPPELLWKWGVVYILQALSCAFAMNWVVKPVWMPQPARR